MLAVSLVLARLVVEPNTPAPEIAEDGVLLVQRKNVSIGCAPTGDAGVDAGVDAPSDAPDAGPDAGTDAGVPDPGCTPITGDAVSLIVRPRFAGDPNGARFALLFVTPNRPVVEITTDPFFELQDLTQTKVNIEIREVPDPSLGEACDLGGNGGCGFSLGEPSPSFDPPDLGDGGFGDGPPGIETVGPYEVVRVQPADIAELASLLDSFGYLYQDEDLDAVAPYIDRGFTVVAVRVAIDSGQTLKPISLTWAGTELRLPAALGAADTQGVTVYVAADGRYEFPGSHVPFAQFTIHGDTSFLTRNDLASMLVESPDDDPVALRIEGDPQFHESTTIIQDKRVPVSDCGESLGCCGNCNTRSGPPADFGVVGIVVGLVLFRRRSNATRRRRRAARRAARVTACRRPRSPGDPDR
jgi:hypothetical protein